ncbi:unknown [Eggerthella sp. CAG:368]|nr:unknown [Eggerthella sp. CAG:368]
MLCGSGIGSRLLVSGFVIGMLMRICSANAITSHFFGAKLLDNRSRNKFGNYIKLARFKIVINDKANKGSAVHNKTLIHGLCAEVGFGFACQGWIVSKKALIVVGVNQNGVKGGSKFFSCANHFFAAHLLFGLFFNLNRRDGGIKEFFVYTFKSVFDATFKSREKTHGLCSLQGCLSFFTIRLNDDTKQR